MNWPVNFGGLPGPTQPLSQFDTMFAQVAAISTIPCSATGTNAISLAPLPNCPALAAYAELCSFRFRAIGSSTGTVTAQHNGLGLLPVYRADGVTQCTTGDILVSLEYILTFSQALNAGAGGFFLEQPAFNPSTTTLSAIAPPGGRLTFQSAVPVMSTNQLNQQTIFYAPYNSPLIPIYNGTNVQSYQYTTSLSDQVGLSLVMGGSANWPSGTMFDLFVTLVAGVPTLCSLAWTNTSTRATGLAIFGGFLTNVSGITARTTGGTISVAANQGTYIGTFFASANGTSQWQFGSIASGGTPSFLYLYNYYNSCLFNTVVSDNGGAYQYLVATVRSARASANNAILFVQGSSEKTALFDYNTATGSGAMANVTEFTGMGVNSTTAFSAVSSVTDNSAGDSHLGFSHLGIAGVGFFTVQALEQGSANAGGSTFCFGGAAAQLRGHIWL